MCKVTAFACRDARGVPEIAMRNFLLLFVFPALCPLAQTYAETPVPYQLITKIPIGGEGGWDILSIDAASRRLYLSHATKVVVVDLEKNVIVGEITDTPGVHAILRDQLWRANLLLLFAERKLLHLIRIDCAIPKDLTSSFVSFS